jgi:hypothetical protein
MNFEFDSSEFDSSDALDLSGNHQDCSQTKIRA